MAENRYDLEDRTFRFAQDVRRFVRQLEQSVMNRSDSYQLVKSSGSVGANYLEANNALGKRDFVMRIRICLKEAKECGYWLRLLYLRPQDDGRNRQRHQLVQESDELVRIFSTIIKNVTKRSS